MLLATGSSFDFMQFFQILCWILLPVFLLAVLLTVFLHFRKKKKEKAESEEEDEKLLNATPELVGYTNGDGEYICFDHSALISEYKSRLSYNHARYAALRHDFEKLESQYEALAVYAIANYGTNKIPDMENNHEQIPQSMQEEVDKLAVQYRSEKEELLARLEQMNQSFKSLEDENQSLQDQINIETASGSEKEAIVMRWKEENKSLKEKVAEQQYLQDVLDEKKAQIDFLQNQLEQRIKNQHQGEQQRLQLQAELEEMKNAHFTDIQQEESLKRELLQKQEEADKLQITLCAKEEELTEKQQMLASKLDHITWLENNLHESKGQSESLTVSLTEAKEAIAMLQGQLVIEKEKNRSLEQKALSNKQALQKIYKEFASVVEEDNGQSPVIALRPEYLERTEEEIVAQ